MTEGDNDKKIIIKIRSFFIENIKYQYLLGITIVLELQAVEHSNIFLYFRVVKADYLFFYLILH